MQNNESNLGRRKYYPGDVKDEISRIRKNIDRNQYGNLTDTAVGMLHRELTAVEMKLESMEDDHPREFMAIEIERRSHLPKSAVQMMDKAQQELEELEFGRPVGSAQDLNDEERKLLSEDRSGEVFDRARCDLLIANISQLKDHERTYLFNEMEITGLDPWSRRRDAFLVNWLPWQMKRADLKVREEAGELLEKAIELVVMQRELKIAVEGMEQPDEKCERSDTELQSDDRDSGSEG